MIGGSEGWRVPGYAVSVEPGFSIALGKNFFALTVPIAVERHASEWPSEARLIRKFPSLKNNVLAFDAAFADYLIIASYSRRF